MLELKFLPEENSVEEKEETRKVEVEEQVELSLTAQEEEFHRYYASLFAVPVSGGSTEAPVRSPGHHLVVEVLDELDGDGNHGNSEDQTETNAATKLDFSEPSSSANTTPGSTTAPPTVGSSGRSSTVHSPSQLKPETTDKLRPPGPPTAGAGGLMKTSRTVTSPHGAVRSPRTTSQENLRSSARVCRSDCFSSSKLMSSSPRPQDQIRPNSQRPQSCCPSPEPNQRRWSSSSTRPSLRSTFTISPFSSAQSPLLPRVHTPTACPSDRCLSNTSSVLSFPRSPEPPLLQTPPPNSQLTAALTPASSPTTSLFNESPSDASLRRTSTTTDGGAAPPASSTSGGHDLTEHGTAPITAPPSPPSSPPLNMKQEEELLIDSEDEMSCDSLGLTFHEEDSSEEEEEDEETPGRSPRATNQHPSDEKVKGRHSDEPQQLSHGSTLIQGWSDGSEPQQFWDVRDRSPQCPDPSPGSSDETRHTPSAPKWMCSPGPAVSCPLVSSPLPASKLSSSCCCSSSSPPPPPPPPPAPGLPPLVSDSELLPSFRPLSRAALEIMEICSVDQTGCEDPDLDNETTAYHLHNLEQELQRVTKDTGTRIMLPAERAAPSGKLPRVPVTEEQREEEEAAQMDRQSVLLLP
ncbi:polycystic kidney disease protein 1-like 3 isoform X3 [Cynoglossus semilaevis]|uniref:polycystic kidney disease protein 1-like 3 isoform X3 n=1 Tax=Cynoglossus semilaevis TaxID=244447 RepID=UPI000D623546|nr:polycystic kidney disease protein 1-like 3 isoform X3 [Cynoglossus semilaevis]